METGEQGVQGYLSTGLRSGVWRSTRTSEASLKSTKSEVGSAGEETAKVLEINRRGGNFEKMEKTGITTRDRRHRRSLK
jgi:hypothetical protein